MERTRLVGPWLLALGVALVGSAAITIEAFRWMRRHTRSEEIPSELLD